jgi:hypothetical protein
MRLLQRNRKDESSPVIELPAQRDPLAERYAVTTADRRTDVTCRLCGKVIAFGVRQEALAEDVRFFHEQHAPFCLRA